MRSDVKKWGWPRILVKKTTTIFVFHSIQQPPNANKIQRTKELWTKTLDEPIRLIN